MTKYRMIDLHRNFLFIDYYIWFSKELKNFYIMKNVTSSKSIFLYIFNDTNIKYVSIYYLNVYLKDFCRDFYIKKKY